MSQLPKSSPDIISTSSSGPPRWKQSPIDLNAIHTWSQKFRPLMINGHWLDEGRATMTNTGQTVKIELTDRSSLPSMWGGPLKDDDYQFANLQFRWGPGNARGAEHSINNFWYSMEAQAIHWNTRYATVKQCYDKTDGMAILSFIFQVVGCPDSPDNPCLTDITESLSCIKKPGTSVSVVSDCMRWMLEACSTQTGYYTYSGSLTTPPYNECVTWIIVPKPIEMSPHVAGLMKLGSSPINLNDEIVRMKKFNPLIINGHWLNDGEAILSNDGETAMVHLTGHRIPSTVTGGPLMSDVYEFHNAHFHWGKDNSNGSEHQINGTWFSMEAHVVHWNRKHRTFDECLNHRDGLCILTYLFLVTEKYCNDSNPQFEKITENLKHIVKPDAKINIPANALCWMRDATRCPSYYCYPGTYNKGSYPECATWIVFPLIVPIAACQVQEFRKLINREGDRIMQNRRAIQCPNGRRIFLASST